MAQETWYVLEDGTTADPRYVSAGVDGRLRHSDGRAVAYALHGPRTRGVDPDAERAAQREMQPESGPDGEDREMKPQRRGRRYKTRSV